MRRSAGILTTIALLGGLMLTVPAQASPGFAHVQSGILVDGAGAPLELHGVSVGTWLLWEHWLMGLPVQNLTGQSKILANLASLVGQPAADAFQSAYQSQFITLADFQQIAALGLNSVRVPFNYRILEDDSNPGVYKPAGWVYLDDVLDWADQTGLYVILDMHGAPGSQNGNFTSDATGGTLLWGSQAYRDRTVNLWKAIAGRYANRTSLLGYDLLNEPNPGLQVGQMIPLYQRIITAIRSVDPNHTVIVEGKNYASDGSPFTAPLDPNLIYEMHQYVWSGGSNLTAGIQNAEAAASRLGGVPVWVGEMGMDDAAPTQAQVQTYNADPLICGWAYWTWKMADRTDIKQGLEQYVAPASWVKVLKWAAGTMGATKPTVSQTTQGMGDFLISLGQTSPNTAVINALTG